MSDEGISLTIIKSHEGSTLQQGWVCSPQQEAPWTLGRGLDNALVVPDPSVSRRHASLSLERDRWRLSNISSNNGLYLDGKPILPGQWLELKPTQSAHIQVGKLLLRLDWLRATQPYTEPLALPDVPSAAAPQEVEPIIPTTLLKIVRDGDCCVAYCKGKRIALKPSSALALYALGQRPGQIVHTWDILDIIDRQIDLPQAISGARRSIKALIEQGELGRAEVIEAILETSALTQREQLEQLDNGELTRHLIFSRRGHGYGLAIGEAWVETDAED